MWQERTTVIAAHAHTGLGQVVRAEREELSRLGDLIRRQAPRGTSIMVPTEYANFLPVSFMTSAPLDG